MKQSYERYLELARAEAQNGNAVAAENYYQHAEHYFRSMFSGENWGTGARPQASGRIPASPAIVYSATNTPVPLPLESRASVMALPESLAVALQVNPLVSKIISVEPPNCSSAADINRNPNPRWVGCATAGPPVSRQNSSRMRFVTDQVFKIMPLSTERAPYFAALVASSCTNNAIDNASFAGEKTAGPAISTRDASNHSPVHLAISSGMDGHIISKRRLTRKSLINFPGLRNRSTISGLATA